LGTQEGWELHVSSHQHKKAGNYIFHPTNTRRLGTTCFTPPTQEGWELHVSPHQHKKA